MKVTIEIGPNRVTKFFSKVKHGFKGFKEYWKQFDGRPASSVKKAA